MQFARSQFTHVPTIDENQYVLAYDRSPFTELFRKADIDMRQLVLRALKAEPMITAAAAPSGIPVGISVESLSRYISELQMDERRIHTKVLGWRDFDGRERRTTYYGLHRKLEAEFFTWGYEKSFLEAFDDLVASCQLIHFDINPLNRELALPEKLHLYHFLQSMVE